MMTITVFGLLV